MRLDMKFRSGEEHFGADLTTNDSRIQFGFKSLVDGGGSGVGLPRGGSTGDILVKTSDADFDADWFAPANAVEADNTLPITSAAVYTEIGNINALLATI
jgi:hypothetical protein